MLVIERDDIAAGREGHQVVTVAVVADLGARAHLGGAVRGVRREHAEPDAQADGRLAGHPGELAGADHADHRHRRTAGNGCGPGGSGPGRSGLSGPGPGLSGPGPGLSGTSGTGLIHHPP